MEEDIAAMYANKAINARCLMSFLVAFAYEYHKAFTNADAVEKAAEACGLKET